MSSADAASTHWTGVVRDDGWVPRSRRSPSRSLSGASATRDARSAVVGRIRPYIAVPSEPTELQPLSSDRRGSRARHTVLAMPRPQRPRIRHRSVHAGWRCHHASATMDSGHRAPGRRSASRSVHRQRPRGCAARPRTPSCVPTAKVDVLRRFARLRPRASARALANETDPLRRLRGHGRRS